MAERLKDFPAADDYESGDFLGVDSTADGTRKVSRTQLAAGLAAEGLVDAAILTTDDDLLTRDAGVPARITRAALAADPAFSSQYAPLWVRSAVETLFPVFDSFDRPDGAIGSTDSGAAWSALSGTWTIASNTAKALSGERRAAVVDAGVANGWLRAEVRLGNGDGNGNAGFVFRAIDVDNYLFVRCTTSGNQVLLRKAAGGTDSPLVNESLTLDPGQVITLEVKMNGAQITVYVDGTEIIDHTLTGGNETLYEGRTLHGLFANFDNRSEFRDFSVERLR